MRLRLRRGRAAEQEEKLAHALDTIAQQLQLDPAASLPPLKGAILQRLSEQEMAAFYEDTPRAAIVKIMQELHLESLVSPFIKYCDERLPKNSGNKAAGATAHKHATKDPPKPGTDHNDSSCVVASRDEYLPWEKSKITSALQREGEIPLEVGSHVAHVVESKIFQAKIRYITTAQIRELVNGELFSMGYRTQLQKQSLLGLPKFNLKSMLYPQYQQGVTHDMDELVSAIAAVILHQYALDEVFGQEVVDAHLSGQIHIEGIAWPLKLFSLLLAPPVRNHFGDVKELPEATLTMLAALHQTEPFAYQGVVVDGLEHYFPDADLPWAKLLLLGMTQDFTKASHATIALTDLAGKFAQVFVQACLELAHGDKKRLLPALVIPLTKESFALATQETLRSVCEIARQTRQVTFTFRPPYLGFCPDPAKVSWVLDSVVVNLVEIACRSGKNQLRIFWDELNQIFSLIVKTHLDKKRFLASLGEGPLSLFFRENWKQVYSLDRCGCYLEIMGLPQAVFYLTGQELFHSDGWEIAVQTLARLQELAATAKTQHGIHLLLGDYSHMSESEQRFIKLDREKFPDLSKVLPRPEYTKGPRLRAGHSFTLRQRIQREAQLHRYAPAPISLASEMEAQEVIEILRFALEETEAVALRM